MVVNDFDLVHVAAIPTKTDTPLVINTNAVLPLAPSLQGFQTISRGHSEIREAPRLVEIEELPSCSSLDCTETSYGQVVE